MTEILLKVALNTITLTPLFPILIENNQAFSSVYMGHDFYDMYFCDFWMW